MSEVTDAPAIVVAEIQKLNPDAEIELFQLDCTIFGGEVYLFHNQRTQGGAAILHDGLSYVALPLKAEGFALNGADRSPTPHITVSSANGLLSSLIAQYDDLVGATVRRFRTFRKFLDDGTEPDPAARLSDDVYFVNRKIAQNKLSVEFELDSSLDVHGVQIPRRRILGRCQAEFKDGINCPYVGADLTCLQTVAACGEKFPSQTLPFVGFPAVERISLTV